MASGRVESAEEPDIMGATLLVSLGAWTLCLTSQLLAPLFAVGLGHRPPPADPNFAPGCMFILLVVAAILLVKSAPRRQ
jgi:hypothetical protein